MVIHEFGLGQFSAVVMGWIQLALLAGSALAGYLAKKKKKQTQTTMPQLDPAYKGLQGLLLPMAEQRLKNPRGLPEGYEAQGITDINRTYNTGQQSIENALTSRGLGSSPIAGSAMAGYQGGRIGNIAAFRNQLPQLERQFQNEDMLLANQLLSGGRGSQTTMEQETGQGGWGGAINSLAQMMGFLYGQGAFGGSGGKGPMGQSQLGFDPTTLFRSPM